tara:strand:- start:80503 stop:81177 length:675 start_codon:yes stop_codon:yes gene_type:complete
MSDPDLYPGLYRLLAWLSPSFPVGAFAYSHGIEWAVEDRRIETEVDLQNWISDVIRYGSGWTDAVLFQHAYDGANLSSLNEQALALAPSKERYLETTAQGTAFLKTVLDAWTWPEARDARATLGHDVAYPIAVALAASGHNIPKAAALHAYLHGLAANLVSAGVRLIPLGQTAGQRILAALEVPIDATAEAAINADIHNLGGIAMMSDIAAMRHETQYTRLFRS